LYLSDICANNRLFSFKGGIVFGLPDLVLNKFMLEGCVWEIEDVREGLGPVDIAGFKIDHGKWKSNTARIISLSLSPFNAKR
jgi:hypothetical protein